MQKRQRSSGGFAGFMIILLILFAVATLCAGCRFYSPKDQAYINRQRYLPPSPPPPHQQEPQTIVVEPHIHIPPDCIGNVPGPHPVPEVPQPSNAPTWEWPDFAQPTYPTQPPRSSPVPQPQREPQSQSEWFSIRRWVKKLSEAPGFVKVALALLCSAAFAGVVYLWPYRVGIYKVVRNADLSDGIADELAALRELINGKDSGTAKSTTRKKS